MRLALLLLSSLLTACGQTGPLYLPERSEQSVGAESDPQSVAVTKEDATKDTRDKTAVINEE